MGAGPAVAAWTNKAMGGDVPFQDALAARLELIHPTTEKIEAMMQHRNSDEVLTPGIRELMKLLKDKGKQVFLVSGGFRFMINPIAEELGEDRGIERRHAWEALALYSYLELQRRVVDLLRSGLSCSGIPTENVFANTVLYDDDGEYKGFDPDEFTSQAGGTHSSRLHWPGVPSAALPFEHFVECCLCGAGKANAVAHIKATKGFETVVMIGDGATDAEAKDAEGKGASLFVGFGGIARRESVEAVADWYLLSFEPLVELLKDM